MRTTILRTLPRRLTIPFLIVAMICLGAAPLLAGDLFTVEKKIRMAEAKDGQATIYVVRPAMVGKAIKFWAFCDDMPLGVTKGKTYTFGHVAAGKHVFWSKAENVSAFEMEVEAGKTYYLWQKARMGGMKARVKLMEATEAEGQAALKKGGKYTSLTAEGETRAKELAAEYLAIAQEKAAKREAEG